jgi:hypothetical protein
MKGGSTYDSRKATINVMIMEARYMRVAIHRPSLNINFTCLNGPTRKKVLARRKMLPREYTVAN